MQNPLNNKLQIRTIRKKPSTDAAGAVSGQNPISKLPNPFLALT
jgi:hypothetical protein